MSWFLPDWLTGFDAANAQKGADAEAALRQMNSADATQYGTAWAATVGKDFSQSEADTPTDPNAQRQQITDAFTSRLDSEFSGVVKTPLELLWAEIKAFLKALPWWVWVGLAVAAFIWLGGLKLLRGVLAK